MGWYGRDKAVKHYSIGFTEKELQELEAAYEKVKIGRFHITGFQCFSKLTSFIRYLALTYLDLEKKYMQLKSEIKQTQFQGKAIGDTWTGYYRNVKKEGNIIFPEWG